MRFFSISLFVCVFLSEQNERHYLRLFYPLREKFNLSQFSFHSFYDIKRDKLMRGVQALTLKKCFSQMEKAS